MALAQHVMSYHEIETRRSLLPGKVLAQHVMSYHIIMNNNTKRKLCQ